MARGFTLLEALVVLMISSLITLILLQIFLYLLNLNQRIVVQRDNQPIYFLQEMWFRQTTEAIIAQYTDIQSPYIFKGNAEQFSGMTIASLTHESGVPYGFSWQLVRENDKTILRYQDEMGQNWDIMHWQGTVGEFHYIDYDGQSRNEWSLETNSAVLNENPFAVIPQLPVAITLTAEQQRQPVLWWVKIKGRLLPRIDYRLLDLD